MNLSSGFKKLTNLIKVRLDQSVLDQNKEYVFRIYVLINIIGIILVNLVLIVGYLIGNKSFSLEKIIVTLVFLLIWIIFYMAIGKYRWKTFSYIPSIIFVGISYYQTFTYGFTLFSFGTHIMSIILATLFVGRRGLFIILALNIAATTYSVIQHGTQISLQNDEVIVILMTSIYYLILSLFLNYFIKNYATIVNKLGAQAVELSKEINFRKLAESEIKNQKDQQEEMFLNMSHELRNPMNVITGVLDLIKEEGVLTEDYLDTLTASSKNMLSIINGILDYSKLKNSIQVLQEQKFNIRELVGNIMSNMKYKIDEKGNKLYFKVDMAVPKEVIGDMEKLNIILSNLVSNAVKFTEKGILDISVDLLKEHKDKYEIEFVVKDTGIGISQENLKNIFNSFFQADKELHPGISGSGLGLTIVRKLIDTLEGKILVRSELGAGTEFKFVIPFRKVSTEIINHVGKEKPAPTINKEEVKDKTILVVDDDKMNQMIINKILAKLGFTVETASDGEEAIQVIKHKPFDIVLMDLLMPKLNGFDTCKAIRSEPINYKGRVIALSAHVEPDIIQKAREYGFDSYISKPIEIDMLKQKLLEFV